MSTANHIHNIHTIAYCNENGVVRVVNSVVTLRVPVVLLVLGLVIINLLLG